MNSVLRVAAAAAVSVLAGCAAPSQRAAETAPAADWPAFAEPSSAETVYRIDESASLLLARVDPAGAMARLGHSHVVGGPVLSGRLVAGPDGPRADLRIDTGAFDVDRPAWRRAHGLKPELDASAVEGTRDNLLGPDVLDADNHPTIDVRSTAAAGPDWLPEITLRVRWRDRVREYAAPVAIDRDDDRVTLRGLLDLHHSDFGFQPFSAAGGALSVSDRIRVRFRIVAVAETGDIAIIADRPTTPEDRP
jgi:hypothetical protein